jgi:hypothetical protein
MTHKTDGGEDRAASCSSTRAHSGVVDGLSEGGIVALPDRVPLPNRPDGAYRLAFPSVRLTVFPRLFSAFQIRPRKRRGRFRRCLY